LPVSYAPGNVRWATPKEQANNRSTNKHVTIDGQRLTYAEAAERHGVPYKTLVSRKGRGWKDYEAVHGKGAIDPSPSTTRGPVFDPAPPGWDQPYAYVPRLDPKYADRFEFPLEEWPWPEDIARRTEDSFQFECKAGHRRIDHLLLQLGGYIVAIERHYAQRIEAADAKIAEVEEFLLHCRTFPSKLPHIGVGPSPYSEPDEPEVEHLWVDRRGRVVPPEKQADYEARYQQLLADADALRREADEVLAPFRALCDEANYRIHNARLPSFWRAVAARASRVPVRRPDVDQDAW